MTPMPDRAWVTGNADSGDREPAERAGVPGKRALTDGLSAPAAPAGSSGAAAEARAPRPGVTAALYLRLHGARVVAGLRGHLAGVPWPPPHPRLAWKAEALVDAAVAAMATQIGAPAVDPTRLLEIVYPANPWPAVDACRPIDGVDTASAAAHAGDPMWDGPLGSRDWDDAVALALAMIVEGSVRASLQRLTARYLEAFDRERAGAPAGAQVASPTYGDLLTSHPMDRVMARALTTPGVVQVTGEATKASDGAASRSPATLRPVFYEWQGHRDAGLWNWLKAIEPGDATAEEVAETLWGDGQGESASYYAYGLTSAPPYFGLPAAWARQFPDARAAEPRRDGAPPDDPQHRLVALAGSAISDELALARTRPAVGADMDALRVVLDTSAVQVEYLAGALERWGAPGVAEAAAAFIERRRSALATATTEDVARWAPVVQGQQDNLRTIATAVAALSERLGSIGVDQPDAPDAAPFRDVFITYGRATASAHLVESSQALIATASRTQAMLVSHLVQARVRAAGVAVGGLESASTGIALDETERQESLEAKAAAVHTQLLLGNAPSAEDVDEITLSADELALRAQLRTLGLRLGDLSRLARLSTDGLSAYATGAVTGSDALGLDEGAALLSMRLAQVEDALDGTNRAEGASADRRLSGDERQAMRRRQRRAALTEAQQRYAAIGQEARIGDFLRTGHEAIQDLERRTRVAQVLASIALLVGVSVLTAGIGNAVTAGARGLLLARSVHASTELAALSRTALLATRAGGLAVESTLNAGAQSLGFDANLGEAFGADLVANLASAVALRPFQQILADLGPLEQSALSTWRVLRGGQVALAKGAVMTAEGITSAAVGYVAHRLVSDKPPDPATLESWLIQGMSIGIGRFVHAQLGEHAQRIEHLAALRSFQRGLGLKEMYRAVDEQAVGAMTSGDRALALGALIKRRLLLQEEQRMLDELLAKPEVAASGGLDRGDIEAMRMDVGRDLDRGLRGEYALLPFRMAGLTEVVTGTVWTGSPRSVEYVLEQGTRTGLTFVERERGRRWSVDVGNRVVDVVVVGLGIGGTFAHLPRVTLAGDDPAVAFAAENLPPEPGFLDVAVHGRPDAFVVRRFRKGRLEDAEIDHRALARDIAKRGLGYEGIRLVSCSTGAGDLAQNLATKLGVTVLAPSHDLGVNPDGTHAIGRTPEDRAVGRWIAFEPRHEPQAARRVAGAKPTERRVDRFHRERAAAAREEIAALPVRRQVVRGRTEYLLSSHAATRLAELLSFTDGVSTQRFPGGLLVRSARSEWYFTHETAIETQGAAAAPTGDAGHAGNTHGLPPPNAWTLELWGFRGVREIQGRPREQWHAADRAAVNEIVEGEPLLYAGHVGVSFDGGKTIFGFSPEPRSDRGVDRTLDLLKAHVTLPGKVSDDTQVFSRAREMASKKGWNTMPSSAVLRLDAEVQERIVGKILQLAGGDDTGLGYTFPLPAPLDGSHYRDSPSYSRDCTANCAVWPRLMGMPIPEASGNLERYMPELRKWSEDDHPIDTRGDEPSTGVEP